MDLIEVPLPETGAAFAAERKRGGDDIPPAVLF